MILWVKRGAAISSSILLTVALYKHPVLAIAGATLNLAWVVNWKMPPALCQLVGPFVLVINTVLSAYGILMGAPAVFALLAGATSLLSWNMGLFLQRWENAPSAVRYLYLKQLGVTVLIGLGAGLSALTLQGRVALPLVSTFLMLGAGFLWLRMISKISRKERLVK